MEVVQSSRGTTSIKPSTGLVTVWTLATLFWCEMMSELIYKLPVVVLSFPTQKRPALPAMMIRLQVLPLSRPCEGRGGHRRVQFLFLFVEVDICPSCSQRVAPLKVSVPEGLIQVTTQVLNPSSPQDWLSHILGWWVCHLQFPCLEFRPGGICYGRWTFWITTEDGVW